MVVFARQTGSSISKAADLQASQQPLEVTDNGAKTKQNKNDTNKQTNHSSSTRNALLMTEIGGE